METEALVIYSKQSVNCFCKGQTVIILGFLDRTVFVATIQFCTEMNVSVFH